MLCQLPFASRYSRSRGSSIAPRNTSSITLPGARGKVLSGEKRSGPRLWTDRQACADDDGVLATAGGVVFAGALDRTFAAHELRGSRLRRRALATSRATCPSA